MRRQQVGNMRFDEKTRVKHLISCLSKHVRERAQVPPITMACSSNSCSHCAYDLKIMAAAGDFAPYDKLRCENIGYHECSTSNRCRVTLDNTKCTCLVHNVPQQVEPRSTASVPGSGNFWQKDQTSQYSDYRARHDCFLLVKFAQSVKCVASCCFSAYTRRAISLSICLPVA